ncbi:HAMP domain-containing protein [Pseudomonas lini]
MPKTASAKAGEHYSEAFIGIVTVAVMASMLTVLLAWLLTRSILTPLNRAVLAAETIAGGNLSKVIEVDGNDEPARLLGALSAMQANLRKNHRTDRWLRDATGRRRRRAQHRDPRSVPWPATAKTTKSNRRPRPSTK